MSDSLPTAENDAPDVYVSFGDDLLGPWENLSPEVRKAWRNLQAEVDRLIALRSAIRPVADGGDV